MADVVVAGDELVVRLSGWERAAAMRGDVRVPLQAVRSAGLVSDPWHALRGIRSPGTGWPGVIAYGTRRMTGERPDFSAVLRGRQTVLVELDPPSQFGQLLVSVGDGEATVERVREAAGLTSSEA